MITYEQARLTALTHIKPYETQRKREFPEDSLVIEHSSEFENGWFFYFNSRLFLETRQVAYRSLGLGPVLIGKKSGEVFQAGSGGNEDYWIAKFNEEYRK